MLFTESIDRIGLLYHRGGIQMPYSLTEGTNTRAPNEVERCVKRRLWFESTYGKRVLHVPWVGSGLAYSRVCSKRGREGMIVVKTIVSTFTVMMMLLILLFCRGKDKATIVGFSFMEALYAALLYLAWRG